MSKIHIKMLTDDALNFMKNNTATVAEKVKENSTNEWIYSFFPQKMFEEKKFEINDFSLDDNLDSNDSNIDFKNSINLYKNLKDLPRYILTDVRFWLWLHLEKFYPVVRNMMKIKGKSTIENMWMHKQGARRSLMFGVLSRCFFRVQLSVEPTNKENPYELTKWVIENPLRYRELSWRAFSSESHLVRGVLKGEKKAVDKNGEKNEVYPKIAKYISFLGSVRLLDAISEEDISEMVYNKMTELMNGVSD